MAERLQRDYGWTRRQREVLSLLAQGRTNGEIAAELGISLAGAKWHVSEIISKLGVDSREEAAEYWRAYNGLSRRFARVFRGLIAGAAAKWTIAGGAAASTAAGAVIVAIVVAGSGDGNDSNQPLPDATATPGLPAASPSPPPTPSTPAPTPAPVLVATPGPETEFEVNGRAVPLADAGLAQPATRLANLSLVLSNGPFGSPGTTLERYTWNRTGDLEVRTLLSAAQYGGSSITGIGSAGSVIVAGVCLSASCGDVSSPPVPPRASPALGRLGRVMVGARDRRWLRDALRCHT
jgi:DNA-binding CsgD family transcriptional regulator